MRSFAVLLGLTLAVTACAPSDARITESVQTKIASDPMVSAAEVNVLTRNKVVTLTGTVDSRDAKREAVRVAWQADGVKDVIDRLRVSETAGTTGR